MNRNALVTGLIFLAVFVAGFTLGRLTDGGVNDMARNIGNSTVSGEDTNSNPSGAQGGATVNTNNLSEGQRKMLESMGIDADSVNITPQMIACAEAKLGASRVEEIKNGATPSFTEGASLVACYR